MFKMASCKDKPNKLLSVAVNNKTMADAKNDERVVDIDTLRQFTIPKMRKSNHELLENVSVNSVQYQREILQVLHQSYQDRKSTDRFVYSQPKLVHNGPLLNEFLEKRKAMRHDRTDKELQDTYGFIAVKTESEVKKYCAEGIKIGNSSLMCLGNPAMGVYLCKHADILQPTPFFDGQSAYIVIFKIIKGKTKLMVENRVGEPLDPTPDFDCHLSKNANVDMTTISVQEAYESTQLYIYEYTEDLDITERPRQVVPYAVVSFRYAGSGSSRQKSTATKKVWLLSEYASRQTSSKTTPAAEAALAVNSSLSKQPSMDSALSTTPQKGSSVQGGQQVTESVSNEMSLDHDATDGGDIIWTGQLCMQSAVISDVELVSYSNFNLPWHLEPWLNLDHDRISYDEIVSYYQLGLLAVLPRDQECRASGKFYNYCELRPMSGMSKNFLRAVNLISMSKCGSRIKLSKGVDLIILPRCRITYRLGLCSKRPDRAVLHCIIISTMSSTYQQDLVSKPHETATPLSFSGPSEFTFKTQTLENGLDLAYNVQHMPYQENIVSPHSFRQSVQFMQSYPGIPLNEQILLQHGQHGSIPFSPFPATTPAEATHPLGLSSTADVPFSLSKLRHYDPRLARRLEMPPDYLPHITSEDVLRLNLPASDLSPALQTDAGEGGICPEQSTANSGKRHDSLQERIDRMQAELDAQNCPDGFYQSDTDTETEYSPSPRFRARGTSSSNSDEDEELELDIIKLRRPTALGHLEKNEEEEQTNEETMEVDEGNMADDLVDEIVRMKPLQAKAARETFGGTSADQLSDSRQEEVSDTEPQQSTSLTDCLVIDVNSPETSENAEETKDDMKNDANDLSVVKSSSSMSVAQKDCTAKTVLQVADAAVGTKTTENVPDQADGLLNKSSKPADRVDPLKISEEHPLPKKVPEILSPSSCDMPSGDNSRVPVLSVDVVSSPGAPERIGLNSKIASADEVASSNGLRSAALPETCLDEALLGGTDCSRTIRITETGKLSVEIHSDVHGKSATGEMTPEVQQVASSALEQTVDRVDQEEQIFSCVEMVLHRVKRRHRLLASSKEADEAEHQMEMIWKLGLHYLPFFLDRDDDDNREINTDKVRSISSDAAGAASSTREAAMVCQSKTLHTNTFASLIGKESVQESNKSKFPGLSSASAVAGIPVLSTPNKLNRVQNYSISGCTCTTDIVRPQKRRSRSISSGRRDSSYRHGAGSFYEDEHYYQNRTRDYRFRDDRFHPYYRCQDNTRARIDREEFYKVYREHRNLEELLDCLTKSQFESRHSRPILAHLSNNPSAEAGSAQSSPRFRSSIFRRATTDEADDILGRRDKVDDCLEDEMFGRDEVPNFYEKKAIADAIDDIFGPSATESPKPQRRSSSVVSNPPKIACSPAASHSAAEGSPDAKSDEINAVAVSSSEFSCLSFTNAQILIPFLEDVASPSPVEDSVATIHTKNSAGVKPNAEIHSSGTGKMEMKWPSHLATVDIPINRPECHRVAAASGLLELISAEIISSCDPRLSPNVPNTSVYASLAHGTQNASLFQRGGSRQGFAGEDRSIEGLEEELREMAKNLKVRVHINPKFLPILADQAAVAGGGASVASLLHGRMTGLDQVQGANNETSSVQRLWQGNEPGKDRKMDSGLEKEASRNRVQAASKDPLRNESETEGRGNLNSDSRSSGPAGRVVDGPYGQGSNWDGKDKLTRIKVDPENRASEFRLKQSELQCEIERDENEQNELVAEVVHTSSSSGVPSGLTMADSQKTPVPRLEEILPSRGIRSEFLVSVKQEGQSTHEGSTDGSVVTGQRRSTVSVDGNQALSSSGTSDRAGVDQGQGKEAEGSGKGGIVRDSSAYLRKQDKQKLKEEVLLLEKMVAEKKALQFERENRERNGGKLASKEKLQQRTVATDDRETRKFQHKSATSTTERLQRRLLSEEKQRAAATTTDKFRRHAIDERHRLGPDDRSRGLLSERQTSSVSFASSGENKLRRDTSDNQEIAQTSDSQEKPTSFPSGEEEKLRKATTSDYRETAQKSDSQDKQKIEDQDPKAEFVTAYETAQKERPKKKDCPERQEMPALFPAFQYSNISQPKDKVPAVNIEFEQPSRTAAVSQEHTKPTRPKTATPKCSKENEEQREGQKHMFQSPQHSVEVRDAGKISLGRTPSDVADPATCSCGFVKGKKLTMELCDFCLHRQSLRNSESVAESSSALSDLAKFASPISLLPSAGHEYEVDSSNMQDDFVSGVDDKNSADGESLDAVDNAPSHLTCLCPETQFESQFYDCASVRRIHLEATKEWMSQKPLEMLICGRLKDLPRLLQQLPADIANDPLIVNCLKSFSQSVNEILEKMTSQEDMKGSDAEVTDTEAVETAELPCATEQLANSLFEEVRQHLEFLSEKSLLQNMEVTRQPSGPTAGQDLLETVTPRVSGPERLQTIPVLKKPSKYSTVNNTGIEAKTAHCDGDVSEVLHSHIRLYSSPQQVVKDEDKSSCREEPSYKEDIETSRAQLPSKDVVHNSSSQETTLPVNYKSSCRVPYSAASERLRERNSTDAPRIHRSHEMEHGWRRGIARGRDIPFQRRGFDTERRFYQNRGRDAMAVVGPRNESFRFTEHQYRMKQLLHDSPKKRKHSRSQSDDRNDPRAPAVGGRVEDYEPKRCRKENVKEPDRDLKRQDDTWEEKLEKRESLEKKSEKVEPLKELDSSEVKDPRKGMKKAKKNKKEKQEGDSSKKVKEKKEKKKIKKKKKTEAEKAPDDLLLDKPADSKVALSHLLSDTAESVFAQANTDSGSAFAQFNDDLRIDKKDPTPLELVGPQAALDFRNLFKCPSDVKVPQVELSLTSPPLMKCFLDKNIDYADVMHKLADVIPGTGNFDAKHVTPQTSFIYALALAVFKDEGKTNQDIKGSTEVTTGKLVQDFEVGEGKDVVLESHQSLDGEAAESGDKTSAQKSPGSRSSNLMQAFRQVVEAKRRAQEQTKAKQALSKLNPEKAAKRAAPKPAKPLFKPPISPDLMTLSGNSSSGGLMASLEVLRSTKGHLAENLARDAFINVYLELQLVLEESCGLKNPERTVPPPLKFYLVYTHFAPLSLFAMNLYQGIVSATDEEQWAADQKILADVELARETSSESALNCLKRKRTDTDSVVCALLKKPREQTERALNVGNAEDLANQAAKDMALGNDVKHAKVVPAGVKAICLRDEGDISKEQPFLYAQDFDLHDNYLPASDGCEGLDNSLSDESESPPNVGNFVSESDNSEVRVTNTELSCQMAVSDSSQRFLNAKGPRFMQTFRQNQIAKRRSQKEGLRTATGGKLLHSKHTLTVSVAKPKPIGMTLEETLAVLSGHHSPVINTSATVTSGTTDVSMTLTTDVSAEILPTNTANISSPPAVSGDDMLPIETVTTLRSPTTHPLQDLTTIPLPPSAVQEDPFDAMDLGSPSESSGTVEPGTSFSILPVTVPYVTQPISCSTSFSSSFLPSSSSDCYSGYEVSCAPPTGHLASYLLPTPPLQTEDIQVEDSTTAVNIQPPYHVSSASDTGQVINSDWQYEYFPPPVDLPPGSYSSVSTEKPVQPPCLMPQRFPSPRPYLLETPPDIQPAAYPCMPNELPPRYSHPCPDQRSWDNTPHPPPQPFPPPHPPQCHPWRGGRPPPMNMMMPPDGGRPRFRPPPPGVNANMGPKRPLLLRPPSSSSGRGGLLPHPGCIPPPPPFAAGFRERSASDPGISREDGNGQQMPVTSATDVRMYIFNKDKAICKSIQRFLEFLGARAFDPYNIESLQIAADDICTVLIHEGDFGILHHVPNLLRLKRDVRVTFSGYKDVMDVKFKNFIPLFPSAGLVVIDNEVLLSCKSESLQMLCEFMQTETKERKSWSMIVSPQILSTIDKILGQENLDDVETSARLTENKRLISHFLTLGVIQQMTDDCHPLSSLDYQMNCIALQSMHCKKYRHFIFITDFPKSHPDSNLFLDFGIDLMNIPEFLNAYVGKSVDQPKQLTSVEAHSTKLTGDAFADSRLSNAIDSCVAA